MEKFKDISGIEKLKRHILSAEQYMETEYAQNHIEGDSYIYTLQSGEKSCVYIGASHTNDPDHALFAEINTNFTSLKPDIVLVEGTEQANNHKEKFINWLQSLSHDDAKHKGEPIFVLKLAIDEGVDFESPEPTLSSEVNHLLEVGFLEKDIFNFYMYRVIEQYQRESEAQSVEECLGYLRPFVESFQKNSGFDPTVVKMYEAILVEDLDVSDRKYKEQVDPIPWEGNVQTSINEIARASSAFRDSHIFERIVINLQNFDKVMVVYGSAHAVVQEPALRALFKEFGEK